MRSFFRRSRSSNFESSCLRKDKAAVILPPSALFKCEVGKDPPDDELGMALWDEEPSYSNSDKRRFRVEGTGGGVRRKRVGTITISAAAAAAATTIDIIIRSSSDSSEEVVEISLLIVE
jgi:hypothetical protein